MPFLTGKTEKIFQSPLTVIAFLAFCACMFPACTTIVLETPTGYDVRVKSPFTRTSTDGNARARAKMEAQVQNHVRYDNALEEETKHE